MIQDREVLIRTNFHKSVRIALTDQFCKAVLAVAAARDVLFNAKPAIVSNWRSEDALIDVYSEYYSFHYLQVDPKHLSTIYPDIDITVPIVLIPQGYDSKLYEANLLKAVGMRPKDGPSPDGVSVRSTFYFKVDSYGRMTMSDYSRTKGIYLHNVLIDPLIEIIKSIQPNADIGY